jgi:hypothetical protein
MIYEVQYSKQAARIKVALDVYYKQVADNVTGR